MVHVAIRIRTGGGRHPWCLTLDPPALLERFRRYPLPIFLQPAGILREKDQAEGAVEGARGEAEVGRRASSSGVGHSQAAQA